MIMSFNLINASAIFQTYINKSLIKLIDRFCVIYLNNIFIYFDLKSKHLNHIKQMFERLHRFNLYINLKKCEFFIIKIKILNFIMFINNVSMNKRRIKTI